MSVARADAPNVLLWHRQDLRLHDNAALAAALTQAASRSATVACVFIWSAEEEGAGAASPPPGGASRLWLHHALAALDADLQRRFNTRLHFAHGPHAQALAALAGELRADVVHCSARYEPAQIAADVATAAALRVAGVALTQHAGFLLHEPHTVALDMEQWAGHFGACVPVRLRHAVASVHERRETRAAVVSATPADARTAWPNAGTLSPFMRACQRCRPPPPPLPPPPASAAKRFVPLSATPPVACVPLEALGLARMPRLPDGTSRDWGSGIRAAWGSFSEVREAVVCLRVRRVADALAGHNHTRAG
jgi:hypothetical protein